MERKLEGFIFWFTALLCLFAGFYVAFDHTFQLIRPYNFIYGPVGDQSTEMATHLYPMLVGHSSWEHIFKPFSDHRIVIERFMMIYDFIFHKGVETSHPYRLSMFLWLNFSLLALIIFKIKTFPTYIKLLLTGCTAAILFCGYSLMNYGTPMFVTWPPIMLFALLTFCLVSLYCDAVEANQWRKSKCYFFLITFMVIMMLATFNIGLIMWPVIFIMLYKRKAWNPHWIAWLVVSVITYRAYFWHWHPGSAKMGILNSFKNPFIDFFYYSRLVSIPLVSDAPFTHSTATIFMAILVTLAVVLYLLRFWLKRKWTNMETIIFGYFLFSFASILLISVMRAPNPAEYAGIGLRFITPGFMVFLCLWISIFIFRDENNQSGDQSLVSLLMLGLTVWLTVLFIPQTGNPYDVSVINEYFIALSTNVPLNENFISNTKIWNADYNLKHVIYNNKIQKQYNKGIYSVWPSQYINQIISFDKDENTCRLPANAVQITRDLRKNKTSLVFLQAIIEGKNSVNNATYPYLLFTDKNMKLVGYAMPIMSNGTLWEIVVDKYIPPQKWRGAVNTQFLKDNSIELWAARQDKTICKIGSMKL